MKNKILIIILAFVLITVVIGYMVFSYRSKVVLSQKLNKEYESYYNVEMLGTELISIINKTIDTNNKNGIQRDSDNYYIDNGDNSIHIYIKFVYKDEVKEIQMEDIEKNGTESFIRIYSTENFKCTNIEYHRKTKNVKSLTFEEI